VRFICGTQDRHKELERRIAGFLGFEDAILYGSCFDANGGLFETLLGEQDAVISDALNHASIIDGIRLCKAQRFRFTHDDMADLEGKLREAAGARIRMIATDGVFSMDGDIARLDVICELAEKHGAMVMVDDSHATGVLGKTGRGTPEHRGSGLAGLIFSPQRWARLWAGVGGFTAGAAGIVELLRNRSRPYLVQQHPVARDRGRESGGVGFDRWLDASFGTVCCEYAAVSRGGGPCGVQYSVRGEPHRGHHAGERKLAR